ncbi:hypothetical protein EV356DRAFT_496421 [Viridothelium virens]|uniref:Cupin 2 conserved barrel domain-containing protein n=1 Tax=Viridothelium virens TaxID=1048519 RepID=A0A6A6GU66_VIRVR|nr:hypothetical protein EV356DRAFT_496421 [Viridothelium virens]
MAYSAAPPLPDPTRYITDNDDNAISTFSNAIPPLVPVGSDLGGALVRLGYLNPKSPAQLTNQTDLEAYQAALTNLPPLVPSGGVGAVWFIDTPPQAASPMHRTISLDIVIQLEGEIELTLDSGEKRMVKPGEVTIQRSTKHAWYNPSLNKWTRMIAVMTECQEVQVGNQTLGATGVRKT